ncbi:BREX-3 system phosphatase PglZ [Enterococcus lactis]|uniref:BREX-3 system phosphatase PglZ n=1 Tax=Enterococcus lactis TaxID=357441 RepID=UPI0039A49CAB
MKMNWIKEITDKFPQKNIYLVRDDDELLMIDDVKVKLFELDISVITYGDPVHFRYTYGTKFGRKFDGTLLIRLVGVDFYEVPWDVYQKAFRESIGIADIFPFLDSKAVKELGIENWEQLYNAQQSLTTRQDYVSSLEFIECVIYHEADEYISMILDPYVEDFMLFNKKAPILREWGEIARLIGEHRLYRRMDNEFELLVDDANKKFQEYLKKDYDRNLSLPPAKQPNYVNQILNYLHRMQGISGRKLALIVMDGMSFTQWSVVEKWLVNKSFDFQTMATMAMIPTITSVSRQAIFSGRRPSEFPETITRTSSEPIQWRKFWKEKGFLENSIKYQKGLGHADYQDTVLEYRYAGTDIYGCVIDVVDEFMHGAKQGLETVQSELRIWLEKGFLEFMLRDLMNLDYDVYITSDHGNVEATGIGRIQEGILATEKGQRARIYDSEVLRSNTHDLYTESTIEWESVTLPNKGYFSLIAKEKFAFVPEGEIIMTHGGMHVEEVIVPFVKVLKRDDR